MRFFGLGLKRRTFGTVLCSLMFLPPCFICGQGGYSPVTDANVVELKFNHYFTDDNKSHDANFEWSFTKTEFVLKKGDGPIPAELLKKLLPNDTAVDEVRGQWKLDDDDGQQLVLTGIKSGNKIGNNKVSLKIYKTAPTVVRIGEPQYVFGIGR